MTTEVALRCKMRVERVTRDYDQTGQPMNEHVTLQAVYSNDPESENAKWAKWTPSGKLEITINNPNAFGALTREHEFFVDFTPVT